MERRFYQPSELYNNGTFARGQGNNSNNRSTMIPPCINDDFCSPEPGDRNNGILTMVFIDMQPLESVYPEATAFNCGSLFPKLNKPFYGGNRR